MGGARSSSPAYSHHGNASILGGVATAASPPELAKAGYIAQLYEVAGLAVSSALPAVNEGASVLLRAFQILDDATFLPVAASSVAWSGVSFPLASISASGLATAQIVYQHTPGSVQGTFAGFSGSYQLTVLNVGSDDFGSYAGDGLADDWQVRYFGLNNPLAAPGIDASGTGQTNLFKYVAGLDPLDPRSRFTLEIQMVPGQPNWKKLVFAPRFPDRNYVVKTKPSLTATEWSPLGSSTVSDQGELRTVTDLDASGARKFYQVEIIRP